MEVTPPIPLREVLAVVFTVATVCYNDRQGLEKTSRSVLSQSFPGFEWLVVDGGSTDGTVDLLQSFPVTSVRFVSEPDRGLYDAMNKALCMARGRYIIFMNAGDTFFDLDVLSNVAKSLGDSTPVLLYGDALESDGKSTFYKKARKPEHNRYVMFTHHQAQFYRTDIARSVGYDLSYQYSCDWVLTTRLLRKDPRPLRFAGPVCVFARGGLSQQDRTRRVFNRELYRVYREEQSHPFAMAAAYWVIKVGINKARTLVPALYDRLRYGSSR